MPKRRVRRHLVTQPFDKPYKFIPLTQGQNAIVDVEDFEWLSKWNWCAFFNKCTHSFYAVRGDTTGSILMHRVIMQCGSGGDVDHRNHNTLDNRKTNLRKCTRAQNMGNSGRRINSKSRYKGVYWESRRNRWTVEIKSKGIKIWIGRFNIPEEAARAYDAAAIRYHGEFASLNFPQTQ